MNINVKNTDTSKGYAMPIIHHNERGLLDSVSLRDIYLYLELSKDFSSWAKAQINRVRMIKDVDYTSFTDTSSSRGKASIDYYVTLEMAKHIGMMSTKPAGRACRDYFIKCEATLRSNIQQPIHDRPAKKALVQEGFTITSWQLDVVNDHIKAIADLHVLPIQRKKIARSMQHLIRRSLGLRSFMKVKTDDYEIVIKELKKQKKQHCRYLTSILHQKDALCGLVKGSLATSKAEQHLLDNNPNYRASIDMAHAWHHSGINGANTIGVFLKRLNIQENSVHQVSVMVDRANQKNTPYVNDVCEVRKFFYSSDIQELVKAEFLKVKLQKEADLCNQPSLFNINEKISI